MRRRILCLSLTLAGILFALVVLKHHETRILRPTVARNKTAVAGRIGQRSSSFGRLPLSFEPAANGESSEKKFISRGPGYALGITGQSATLVRTVTLNEQALQAAGAIPGISLPSVGQLELRWTGANAAARPRGEAKQVGVSNYLHGADRSKWRQRVPHFAKVRVEDLYPGVDLVYHGDHEKLEFDYEVRAGADPSQIKMAVGGPSLLSLNEKGELEISSGANELVLEAPVAFQDVQGVRKAVEAKYVLAKSHEVGLSLGSYDRNFPLIIDPVLSFSAHFGSSTNLQTVSDVSVDGTGNIYLTGTTCDVDFPVTPGTLQPNGGSIAGILCDTGIITKLDATASSLIYSTYIGSANNVTSGIRILPAAGGEAVVAGVTTATDFPTTSAAYQTTARGGTCTYGPFLKNRPCTDIFLLKLSTDGSTLVFSTLLGGSRADLVTALTIDGNGNIFLAGATNSNDFPVSTGTVGTALGGGTCQSGLYPCFDAFVAKFNSDASQLLLATFLGGNDDDFASGVVVDSAGNIYVGGTAYSTNFPTTASAFQKTHSAPVDQGDVFVSKLTSDMKTLTYSTFIGGTGFDIGLGLRVDSTGSAYIFGSTNSTDFPTVAGSYQTTYAGPTPSTTTCDTALDSSLLTQPSCGDIFVSKLNAAGSALVYSTYIGGSGQDIAFNAALDSAKNLWLVADTDSIDFPYSSDAYYTSTGNNIALMKLSADGKMLPFATPLAQGNTGDSLALGLMIDATDEVYVAGHATSFLGTPGSYASGSAPGVFVAKYVTGTTRPGVSLSATMVQFPQQISTAGSTSGPQTVTLTNNGNATLHLNIKVGSSFGNPVGPFSETDNCGSAVAAGDSCTISIYYQPSVAGNNDSAQVQIVSDAPNAPHMILAVASSGTIDAASFVPPALTFTGQGPGTTSDSQSSSLNTPASDSTSLLPINTGAPTVSGPNSSEFHVDSSNCTLNSHFCQLIVTFAPSASATGTRTATVSVPTNAPNSPQVLALSGSISTGPTATFPFPPSISPTTVNQTLNTSLVVKNVGGSALNVTGVPITGTSASEFVVSASSCTFPSFSLTSGQQCGLNIAFTPIAHGVRTATLTLTDNEGTPATLVLSAYGKDANGPGLQLLTSPNPINGSVPFADTVVGTTGLFTANIGLLNTGTGSVSIASATLTGDFTQTNNCSGSIAGSSNCTYVVSFGPKQVGARSGTLTIVTNAPGGQTITVNFNGNGVVEPQVSFAPAVLNFGSQANGTTSSSAQTATLRNTGGGTLNIANIAVTGPFSQTTTCGSTLAAGANCTFAVKFAPTALGPATGTLSFKGNGAGGTYVVALNGEGVTGPAPQLNPTKLTFGSQAIGTTSAAQTVTLSNPGSAAFNFGGVQATENYTATSNCPATIAPGASCAITVKFAPTNDTNFGFAVGGAIYVSTGTPGSPLSALTTGQATANTGATTSTTLASSQNPSTVGQSVTFTATVSSTTAGTITGSVTFLDGSTTLGTGTLSSSKATFTTSSLTAGSHSITASYGGDSTFSGSTSTALTQVVNAAAKSSTSTTVTSSQNPSTVGQSVTFTASVSSGAAGTITGTVTFLDGSTTLGTGTLSSGKATFATSALTQGSHSITASYGGDSTFAGSTSSALAQVVNGAAKASTTTTVASSQNPSTVGQSVTFTASVNSGTAGTITGTVAFLDGSASLGTGTVSSGKATFTTTSLASGTHSITAQYQGDTNFATSTSSALTQTVNGPDFSISSSVPTLTVTAGQNGTATVTVTPENGSTQTVTFSCGNLPAHSTCSYSPATATLDGTHSATSTVTITTTARTAGFVLPHLRFLHVPPAFQALTIMSLIAFCYFALLRQKRNLRYVAFVCVAILSALTLASCSSSSSGSSGGTSGTPAGTYSITLTGTSGSTTHNAPLSLTVN